MIKKGLRTTPATPGIFGYSALYEWKTNEYTINVNTESDKKTSTSTHGFLQAPFSFFASTFLVCLDCEAGASS